MSDFRRMFNLDEKRDQKTGCMSCTILVPVMCGLISNKETGRGLVEKWTRSLFMYIPKSTQRKVRKILGRKAISHCHHTP